MSRIFWTKRFYFSASFSRGAEVHGHNYVLAVTLEFSGRLDERRIEGGIQKGLIDKLHSRDLGNDVDFLKKSEITDANLLKAFSEIIARQIRPLKLARLSLERDQRTALSLDFGGSPR